MSRETVRSYKKSYKKSRIRHRGPMALDFAQSRRAGSGFKAQSAGVGKHVDGDFPSAVDRRRWFSAKNGTGVDAADAGEIDPPDATRIRLSGKARKVAA